ncbi:MAG: WXG100 family type VII secretion target [Lachnospiraceae bacterium]|nr:WXG100 family type VII secretion target [Lachnospiraceae bacterium]
MGKVQLTYSEMSSAITNLNALNEQFVQRVNDLVTAQQEVATMWKGDSNTAFNSKFEADKGQWDQFANVINQYIEALNRAQQGYQQAESESVSMIRNTNG